MKPSLVLEAAPWEIADEKTGELRRGFSIFYVDFDSPLIGRKRGYETLRISGPDDVVGPALREVPGFYDLRFRQRAGRNGGRVELSLSSMAFVSDLLVPDEVSGR